MADAPYDADVLVCHASADAPAAHALCTRLDADGVRARPAPVSIRPTASVYESIRGALDACEHLLLLLSSAPEWRVWPQREFNVFWSHGRRVIPLFLDDADPPPPCIALARIKPLDWRAAVRATHYGILLYALFPGRTPAAAGPGRAPPAAGPGRTPAAAGPGRTPAAAGPGRASPAAGPGRARPSHTLLDAVLWPNTLVAVSGRAGMGKATLARASALHRCAHRFTRTWVLDGSTRAALIAGLADVDASDGGDVDAGDVESGGGGGWLILVENVDDGTLGHELLCLLRPHRPQRPLRLLSRASGGCIVVTSQFADWDREGWTMVTVDAMARDEAALVLGPGAPNNVAATLGYMPLALACARAYVAHTRVSWAAYSALLASASLPTKAALGLCVQGALAAVPSTRVLVQLLQLLHPACIDRSLLEAVAVVVDLKHAIATLEAFGVLTAPTETTVAVHRLMHETMRTIVPCELHVAVALSNVVNAMASSTSTPTARLRHLLVHYDVLLVWMVRACPDALEHADALHACAVAWTDRCGDAAKARPLYETALAIRERHFGPGDINLARVLADLGKAHGALGDRHRQTASLERALAIRERHLGPDHVMVARVLVDLGNAHGALGDASMQKALLERALEIEQGHYGGTDHPEVARTLVELGNAYGALGDAVTQRDLLERALAVQQRHDGPDHPDVAVTLTNLGNAYGALGDVAKKKALVERALAIKEAHYGRDHVETAAALASLGSACDALGYSTKAKALLERALAIKERHYGPNHVELASTLLNLGNTHGALGDDTKMVALVERALAIYERHYGPNHVMVATTLNNLGNAYGALGDWARQIDVQMRALAIINEAPQYGPGHQRQVAVTNFNLGRAFVALGNSRQALRCLKSASVIWHRDVGAEHPLSQRAVAACSFVTAQLEIPRVRAGPREGRAGPREGHGGWVGLG